MLGAHRLLMAPAGGPALVGGSDPRMQVAKCLV